MSEAFFPLAYVAFLAGIAILTFAAFVLIAQRILRAKPKRTLIKGIALIGIALSAVGFISMSIAGPIEFLLDRDALHAITIRAQPLVAAITRYENEHGSPPSTLEALVPDYLPQVPGTGWSANPEFQYDVYPDRWRLWVNSFKFGSFDTFEYAPVNRDFESARSTTRIADWVYVHE